ncbi:MAG: GDP-mannose 4,6-dehydratase, partial [Candidatus Aenigmarchaeota archaeon]|nr:GDP-mannose 4,6-dehydratase [Candidatus Aenigmarchaeota archaeon]
GSGEQSRSFVHTSDIVEGTLLGMERAPDGVPINLGTPERVKIKDLARKILRYSGHSPAKIWFNTDRPEGMSDRPADNSRARELIGWEPKLTFDEGLKRTVDGFKKRIRDGDYEKPVT